MIIFENVCFNMTRMLLIYPHFSITDLMYLMVSVAKPHFCQHPITMCIVRGPYWVSVGRFLEKLNGNRYQVP